MAKKGVAVVAVHAGAVRPEVLRKWLKENKISLPAGRVSENPKDAQQQRKAWGVRALPWLILTDKRHIVRAEGFGLAELDERLKEVPE